MNYIPPETFININDYDYIISIGNKCPSTLLLRSLNLYKESFPFDYIPTTPKLILKYLKDQTDFYPKKNILRNNDDVWFGYFDLDIKYNETIETFKRRFERLFNILENKNKILFVYTSEADIYNEMGNRYNDNYNDLCKIRDYIKNKYNFNNFNILAIHVNKVYNSEENIINYSINIPEKYFSDDMSTHTEEITSIYRTKLKLLLKNIFNKVKLTIITPSCRQENILKLYESLNFDKIYKWIIVYDTTKNRKYNKLFVGNEQIIEVECNSDGISGNPQRNYGISLINDSFIYFLDDDNIIHSNFWNIVDILDNNYFYTFDQQRTNNNIFLGNNIKIDNIDTAQFIVHKNHIKDIKFIIDKYNADGYFISDIYKNNINSHKYINEIGCYYNYLTPDFNNIPKVINNYNLLIRNKYKK
jgi:hypothetical protein